MLTNNFINASHTCVPKPKGMGNKPHLLRGFDINIMEEEIEIWKDVVGWEGHYQISNMGRVKSLQRTVPFKKSRIGQTKTVAEKIMPIHKLPSGYCYTIFSLEGKIKKYYIHRLVCIHFIPNPLNKKCVNHKRGNKSDNRDSQLEWCTHSENNIHAIEIGLRTKNHSKRCHKKMIINTDTLVVFKSIKDAHKEYGKFDISYLGAMIQGKFKNKTPYRYYTEGSTVL